MTYVFRSMRHFYINMPIAEVKRDIALERYRQSENIISFIEKNNALNIANEYFDGDIRKAYILIDHYEKCKKISGEIKPYIHDCQNIQFLNIDHETGYLYYY